jgi:hypothetical protein
MLIENPNEMAWKSEVMLLEVGYPMCQQRGISDRCWQRCDGEFQFVQVFFEVYAVELPKKSFVNSRGWGVEVVPP